MRIATISTAHHRDGSGPTYHLYIYDSPWWRYAVKQAYHWYDMKIPIRIPGWRRFEEFLRRHGGEIRIAMDDPKPRWRDRLLAWTINQDIRCFFLTEKSRRKCLGAFKITEEEFLRIKENRDY